MTLVTFLVTFVVIFVLDLHAVFHLFLEAFSLNYEPILLYRIYSLFHSVSLLCVFHADIMDISKEIQQKKSSFDIFKVFWRTVKIPTLKNIKIGWKHTEKKSNKTFVNRFNKKVFFIMHVELIQLKWDSFWLI